MGGRNTVLFLYLIWYNYSQKGRGAIEVVDLDIQSLTAYENNPRNNDAAVDAVAESIKQFGFKVPIVIDADNIIVAGHTRLKAAKRLGLTSVPCIVADDLSPEQVQAFRLADNKTGELAEWDFDKLEQELAALDDIDMSLFGFDLEIDEPVDVVEDDVPEVDETSEPITQLGDVWQLGKHRLMCGDSTDKGCIEQLMDGEQADMLLTDPPYNVAYEGKTEDELTIANDDMDDAEFGAFLQSAFQAAESVMKCGSPFYVWYASREHMNFQNSLDSVGLTVRQQLIWAKNVLVLGRQDYHWKHEPCLYGWKDGASHKWYGDRSQSTILEFDKPLRNAEHPTMKPVELFAYQISNSSKKGDVVLDTFAGSGTTLIACEQLDRICYTMELDTRYCDVIIKRWESLTGETACKIS